MPQMSNCNLKMAFAAIVAMMGGRFACQGRG